jgi:hypothetical protein
MFEIDGPETATRGRVNESLKFLSKYLAIVPNSNPKANAHKSKLFTSQRVAEHLWWWPRSTLEHSRTDGNEPPKHGRKQHFLCTPGLSGLGRRTVRGWAARLSETGDGLSAGQSPKNTQTGKSDLTWAKDTAADCPWRTSGLSGGKMRRRTVTGTDSVRCWKMNCGQSAIVARTVRRSKTANPNFGNTFCSWPKQEERTVRTWGPDCPCLRAGLSTPGAEAECVTCLCSTLTRKLSGFGPGLSGTRGTEQKNSAPKSPSPWFTRFVAKSTPTATKLDPQDYKAVGELSLRDHRPIWSQSTENRKREKNTSSWDLDQEIAWSVSSWGIGWFPSVERLNSRHSSNQCKKNGSKGLETTNQLKNERGKEKNVNNTLRTQRVILPPNPGGYKEDSGPTVPLEILVLTQITRISGLSLTSN